ncbi:hypothetical protein [Leuconostoc citreum]
MAKSKRKARVKLTPKDRLNRLSDKQLAHDMVIDTKREYYETVTKPELEKQAREQQIIQAKKNKKIDEVNRKKLNNQLEYTRHVTKREKVRFIHPK